MKKIKLLTWIVVFALILSACTISAAKKKKPTPTLGVSPTAAGTTIGNVAAATATAQKALPTQQPGAKNTLKPTSAPVEATNTSQPQVNATSIPAATTTSVKRIEFKAGENLVTEKGEMNGGAVKSYVLKAGAGQVLSVEVWSPNGDVYLSISSADGKALLDTSSKAIRWNGAVTANQDYTFTITATGGTTSFSLSILMTATSAGSTPHPTTAPVGTGTPKPTSGSIALGPFDPYTVYGPPSMKDPMNGGNIADWVASDGKLPNTADIKMTLKDAKIYVIGKRVGWATWWFSAIPLDNVYMQMTAETESCAAKDSYGMIMRGPEHGAGKSFGYVFAFSCDGAYQITRLDSAAPFSAVTLIGWTSSDYILAGSYQRNVLGIKMDGKILTIYANGYKLAEITDNVYDAGRYGLYIYPETSNDFTYRVVEMAYWLLGVKK